MLEKDADLIEKFREELFIIPASTLTDLWKKEQSVQAS